MLDKFCKKVYIAWNGGKFMHCDIILLVDNLDVCRYFYREVVGFGEPEQDSNFQVVFRLNEKTSLVLEKCSSPWLEHASGACRFALEVDDLGSLMDRMQKNGTPLADGFSRFGRSAYQGIDPEGNVFLISGKC